jgi:hypothetical protein
MRTEREQLWQRREGKLRKALGLIRLAGVSAALGGGLLLVTNVIG